MLKCMVEKNELLILKVTYKGEATRDGVKKP